MWSYAIQFYLLCNFNKTQSIFFFTIDFYCLANEGIDSTYYMQFSDHTLRYNIEL